MEENHAMKRLRDILFALVLLICPFLLLGFALAGSSIGVVVTAIGFATWPSCLVWSFVRDIRRNRRELYRIDHGLCLSCGYDIRSHSGRCPECGRELKPYENVKLTQKDDA